MKMFGNFLIHIDQPNENFPSSAYGKIRLHKERWNKTDIELGEFDIFDVPLSVIIEYMDTIANVPEYDWMAGEIDAQFIGGTAGKHAVLDLSIPALREGDLIGEGDINGAYRSIVDGGDIAFQIFEKMPIVISSLTNERYEEDLTKDLELDQNDPCRTLDLQKAMDYATHYLDRIEWQEYVNTRINKGFSYSPEWPACMPPRNLPKSHIRTINDSVVMKNRGWRIPLGDEEESKPKRISIDFITEDQFRGLASQDLLRDKVADEVLIRQEDIVRCTTCYQWPFNPDNENCQDCEVQYVGNDSTYTAWFYSSKAVAKNFELLPEGWRGLEKGRRGIFN